MAEGDRPKHQILFRDWKDQVAAAEIDEAIQRVFDGRNAPRLYDAVPVRTHSRLSCHRPR
jgi:hypothetical protein